jgi:hypothetical protein
MDLAKQFEPENPERFKYRYTFTRLTPWTTVVSDSDPLDWLDDALRPLW